MNLIGNCHPTSPTALAPTGLSQNQHPHAHIALCEKEKQAPPKKTTTNVPRRGQRRVIDAYHTERERQRESHERRHGTTNECRPKNTNMPQHRWPRNEPSQTQLAVINHPSASAHVERPPGPAGTTLRLLEDAWPTVEQLRHAKHEYAPPPSPPPPPARSVKE
ncbi:unnamed protein product [Ectocarpus sp. 4 AP-2014]